MSISDRRESDSEVIAASSRLNQLRLAPNLRQDRELLPLILQATSVLQDVAGPSAGLTEAEWDLGTDGQSRTNVVLRVADSFDSVTAVFTPSELRSDSQTRFRIRRLWGDLLQIRSHRELDELQRDDALAEA